MRHRVKDGSRLLEYGLNLRIGQSRNNICNNDNIMRRRRSSRRRMPVKGMKVWGEVEVQLIHS